MTAIYVCPLSQLPETVARSGASHIVTLLNDGTPYVDVAARAGYADQPHLHREVRDLAGLPLGQLASGANRSTEVPSGSSTVA